MNKKYSLLEFFEQINVKFACNCKNFKNIIQISKIRRIYQIVLKNDNYIEYGVKSKFDGSINWNMEVFENSLSREKLNDIKNSDPNVIIENTEHVDIIEKPISDYYELLQQFKFMDFETLMNLKFVNKEYYNLLKQTSSVWCDLLNINFAIETNSDCYQLYRRLMIGLKFDNSYNRKLYDFLYGVIKGTDSIFVIVSDFDIIFQVFTYHVYYFLSKREFLDAKIIQNYKKFLYLEDSLTSIFNTHSGRCYIMNVNESFPE